MGARIVAMSGKGMDFPLIEDVLAHVQKTGKVHPRCSSHYWHCIMQNDLVEKAGEKWLLTKRGSMYLDRDGEE